MAEVSARLRARVVRDFAADDVDEVVRLLEGIDDWVLGGQDPERVLTAVVLTSHGTGAGLMEAVELARSDWRAVLVAAGLADDDWPLVLTSALSG